MMDFLELDIAGRCLSHRGKLTLASRIQAEEVSLGTARWVSKNVFSLRFSVASRKATCHLMKKCVELLPLLAPLSVGIWSTIIYQRGLARLKRAYKASEIDIDLFNGIRIGNAWAVFQPMEGDTLQMIELKKEICNEMRRKFKYGVIIFFGGFFGLAILGAILE
jgi:hypothetical protein